MMNRKPNPVVLIPAFNEAGIVGSVVKDVRSVTGFPVVVIDDASTDGTAAEARLAGAYVLALSANIGAWGATQTGLRFAVRQGFDLAITLDADGQHIPDQIGRLINPITNGIADVVIGAYPERGSGLRRIAWRLLKVVSGIRLEDITSGFRAYGLDAMRILEGWRATYLDFQDVGVIALLMENEMDICDVRVTMRERRNGHSRIFGTWLTVAYYMCHTVLLGLTKRRVKPFHGTDG